MAGFFTREAPVNIWAIVFWRNLFGSSALVAFIAFAEVPPTASVTGGGIVALAILWQMSAGS
jgi:hypothetical protein